MLARLAVLMQSLMGALCGLTVKPPRPRVTEGNPLGHRFLTSTFLEARFSIK